jgi:hypothetical protein
MPTTPADAPAVPGDPDALDALARRCRGTAGGLRCDADLLRGAGEVDGWSGRAADAFSGSVRGLPRDLALAAHSYDAVARALATYAAELRATQARARRAEHDLAALGGRVLAESRVPVEPDADPATVAARQRRVELAHQEVADVRRLLAGLADDATVAASTAACRVRAAADAPREPPGLFERLVDGAGDWVDAHADVLGSISFVLRSVSSIAGALSAVPALNAVAAPIAVTTGVAALLIDAVLASRGKASWAAVGVDAVSTAVPGISRIGGKVVREVRTRRGTVVVYRVEGTPNRRIVLDADNNVRFQKRSMLHVAVGQRAYAERYYAKKVRDGLPGAQLKSFRIPRSEHEALRLRAVAQADAKKFPRSPQVVDPTQAPDLYGLRRSDFRQLQETIVPGSGRVVR